jgi:tetratricopeptide (TPR) repeat protein
VSDSPSSPALGNALPVFRPQAARDPALLERTLCGREHVARMLTERARDSALGSARHQQLVYGPRGSGKTHLLTVVVNRLRADPELRHRVFIVRLAEEQWEVASFFDLCVQILRRLAEEYPDSAARDWEKRLTSGPRPSRQAEAPVEELRRVALRLIQDTLGEAVLLLIVENLDDLFGAIGQEGQQQLRAHIQEVDNWSLIASAQSLFPEIISRSEPFFGFFQTHDLPPLDLASSLAFLRRLAGDSAIGDASLARVLSVAQGEERVRVIHLLCGGNHRLLTMLYPFLTGDGLANLVDPFLRMIDRELTPYYQERLRWLPSAQQRKLVTWLARQEEPQAVNAVARNCFITEQVASTQLRKLAETGFVRLISKGRETFCEVREPLLRFVLDFQEHREGAVRTIVRVLRAWYSPPELHQLENSEAVRGVAMYHQCVRAALQESISSPSQPFPAGREALKLVAELIQQTRYADALAALEALDETERSRPESLSLEALALVGLGRWQEAERRYQEAQQALVQCAEKPARANGLFLCGLCASELGWPEIALKHYQEALGIRRELARQSPEVYRPEVAATLNNLGNVQNDLNDLEAARQSYEEALGSYRELVRERPEVYRPDMAMTLNNLGNVQSDLNDLEAARQSYEEALGSFRELARQRPEVYRPNVAVTLNNLGNVQSALNDLEAARQSHEEALSIRRELARQRPEVYRPDVAITAFNIGLLEDHSGHPEAAVNRFGESVRALLPEYRRVSRVYQPRFRRYLSVWLSRLQRTRGGQSAWEAWQGMAGELPADDPVGRSFGIVTGIWTRRWDEVLEWLRQASAWLPKLASEDREEIASAFNGALRDSEVPTDALHRLASEMPEPLRHACEGKAIALVPSLLREHGGQAEKLRQVAGRVRAVFGNEEAVGKALQLLEAGLNYLEAGRQESAILNLPVEQRRLIIETCGAGSEQAPRPRKKRQPRRL